MTVSPHEETAEFIVLAILNRKALFSLSNQDAPHGALR